MNRVLAIALMAGLGAVAAAPTWGFGDAESGKRIAKLWCSSCHIVSEEEPAVATDGIPPFRSIARNPRNTPARIAAILVDPHPPMPNLQLSNQTIEDIIAYMETLRSE